ncbi:helix-turn-helix transcriptional regulator [Sphaerisporangium sp. NPDC051017]|uniref:helix-turn-helix transcriptional regulator n=1 Tax=Sphaerisporangium sp. NPDC051017 TaxID=3154636 RepID=UPI00343D6472
MGGGAPLAARRRRLAERRRAMGYSQEFLADQLGIDRTTVGRWERGETDPYPFMRPKLCEVLQVTSDELETLLATDAGHEAPTPALQPAPAIVGRVVSVHDPTGESDDMYRREMLRLLSVAGALAVLPQEADAPEQHWIVQAEQALDLQQYTLLNAHLWQVFSLSKSKRLVYPLVHDQLGLLVSQMDRANSPEVRRQLCVLACELFQLAGEIFFDSNRYTDAAYCYTLAASAGREAGSHDQWACALTRQAFVNMYDKQYTQASSILSVAARVAQNGDSQLSTRQWVAAVQAQAFAGLGELDTCNRALDAADRVLDLTGPVNPGGWLRFDGSRLAEERGGCYLVLGKADLAESSLTEALDGTVSLRRRGSLLTDLAMLGVQRRDLDQLLRYAGDAVELAEKTQSYGYVGRKLRSLQNRLEPLLTESRVAQLNDRIAQLPIVT